MKLEFSATLFWLGEERNRRKASKFSDAQRAGISQATYFNWKKKYAGLLPTEIKRLKQLGDENARLEKIVADLTLDREMLQVEAVSQTIRGIVFPTTGHDQLATGKKLRVLTVVDTFSRYVLVLNVRGSYRGEDVVATLDSVCRTAGCPKTIRVDQGSAFVSRDMDLWAYQRGVVLDFSRPGKATDNAFIEAFNDRFRAEYLNQHWFLTLADAAETLGLA